MDSNLTVYMPRLIWAFAERCFFYALAHLMLIHFTCMYALVCISQFSKVVDVIYHPVVLGFSQMRFLLPKLNIESISE